jgi:hypothetical protein
VAFDESVEVELPLERGNLVVAKVPFLMGKSGVKINNIKVFLSSA